MPEKWANPWDTRGRPRASMMTFTSPPWKQPPIHDPSVGEAKPAEWFAAFQKLKNPVTKRRPVSVPSSAGESATARNFIQTELNPSVAFDKTTKKFRILIMDNGNPIPRGSFWTDDSGMVGFSGLNDMIARGPAGIAGVPLSVGNQGPPGVAILPKDHWQTNRGMRHAPLQRPSTVLLKNKGHWNGEPPDHNATSDRADLPAI